MEIFHAFALFFLLFFCFVLEERDEDTYAVMIYEENDDDDFRLVNGAVP